MPYELTTAGAFETPHTHDTSGAGVDADEQSKYESARNNALMRMLDAQRKTLETLIADMKPSEPVVSQVELDTAAAGNFPSVIIMPGLVTARSCYIENPTNATVFAYVGPVPAGVALMRVGPNSFRQYPTNRDTKEVCIYIAPAQLPQATTQTIVRVILTSALWGPGAGAVTS